MKNTLLVILILLCGCAVYTEKRSEALSQSVFATATSIQNARFDKASEYAEQAKRLAYPPKKPINVFPIITKETKKIISINNESTVRNNGKKTNSNVKTNVITTTSKNDEEETVLRLVIPESLKHAKLLVENSEEWNEMLKTKEFKKQLETDNANLKKLKEDVDKELEKQMQNNNKMVEDLNKLQKEVLSKNLHILRLYIVIAGLVGTIVGGVYLRMKGVL